MSKLSAAFESLAPRKPGAPAVILFSGGLDSTTVLALAKDLGYTPYGPLRGLWAAPLLRASSSEAYYQTNWRSTS